ncbi:MAG: hypothetical protein ACLP1D_04145 [Xanthobacteraceae bacterium]
MTEPSADFDHDAKQEPTLDGNATAGNSDSKADASGERAGHDETPPPSASVETTDRASSNIMILWPERAEDYASRSSTDERASEPNPARSAMRRRRRMALAAVAAVAALCGAAGGSLATFAIGQFGAAHPAAVAIDTDSTARFRDAIARVTADVGTLRTDLDRAGHARTTQIAKLGDRMDKVERSQDETATRLTKVSEAQDKLQDKAQDRLRAASTAAAPSDITGTIPAAVKGDLKPDPRKPQVVEGWTLTRVTNGGAIVNGPDGLYEAYPGDPLPGIGRVDAVRYQDGRWVVITPKGLIIRR